MRHEKLRFSNQLPYSLVLRESKRHVLSIGKIYKMTRTNLTTCLFVKNCCSLLKKSDFPLNWYLHCYLRELKRLILQFEKLTMCQNWQCVKIDKLCLFVPKFFLIKNSDFPSQLCVIKNLDFLLNCVSWKRSIFH